MVGATVGAGLGGVLLGSLVSLLAAFIFTRRRTISKLRRQQAGEPIPFISTDPHYDSVPSQSPPADGQQHLLQQQSAAGSKHPSVRGAPSMSTLPREYNVEPYQLDGPPHLTSSSSPTASDTMTTVPQSWSDVRTAQIRPASGSASPSVPDRQEGNSQVYVIHHDSGRAPVSVITSRGTEVVELPPGYSPEYLNANAAGSRNAGSPPPQRRRSGKTTSNSQPEHHDE